jgi:predicted NBD/HSP70 family sugar kinase
MARVIGVDVGGTKVATASLQDGVLGEVRTRPTEKKSPDALVDQLLEAIEEYGDADAVGLGIPSVNRCAARHGDVLGEHPAAARPTSRHPG